MAKATKETVKETTTKMPDKVLTKAEIEVQLQDLLKQLNEAQTKVVMLQGAVQIAQQQLVHLGNGTLNDS